MTRNDHAAFTHIVESWLDSPDAFLDPDVVLDRVMEQVETRPQRRARWPEWRIPFMNKTVPIIIAAAAVVVIGIIGFNVLGGSGGGLGGPDVEPTATAEPTAIPEPSPSSAGDLPVGSSYVLTDEFVTIQATIPASGWWPEAAGPVKTGDGSEYDGGVLAPDGAYVFGTWAGDPLIPSDPCQWASTMPDTPATTLDEIATALANQATRDASAPVDVTVDGHPGKSITLHVPDDIGNSSGEFPDCDEEKFCTMGFPREAGCHVWYESPDEFQEIWIVDVDGEFYFVTGNYWPDTAPDIVEEMSAILGSMTFGE